MNMGSTINPHIGTQDLLRCYPKILNLKQCANAQTKQKLTSFNLGLSAYSSGLASPNPSVWLLGRCGFYSLLAQIRKWPCCFPKPYKPLNPYKPLRVHVSKQHILWAKCTYMGNGGLGPP